MEVGEKGWDGEKAVGRCRGNGKVVGRWWEGDGPRPDGKATGQGDGKAVRRRWEGGKGGGKVVGWC